MSTAELVAKPAIKSASRASLACILAAFLLSGFFAVRNLSTWHTRITYPGEESYEGAALAEIVRLRQGVPIYAPPSDKGFAGATYGPLYYLLGSRLVNPDNPSYSPLRILSALAILGCAACCGLLAFWLSRSYAAAFLGPLVFLSYGMTTDTGISALPDAVALVLFLCGFLVAYRFRNSKAILLAVPVMCLGFYYKPQYVAGPLAVFLFLVLKRRYARAAQFLGALSLLGFGLLGFFQWIVFPGQEFWRHFLFYQAPLLSWHRFEVGLLVFVFILGAPLLLAADYLRRYPDRLLGCYLACAVLLGLATIGKDGSGVRYFFECVLLISTLIPALLAKNIASGTSNAEIVFLLFVSLLCGHAFRRPVPQPADFTRNHAIQAFLRRNFTVHSKSLGVYPADLMQAGLEVPFDDLYQLSQLAHRGKVSDRGLVGQVRNRRFAVIVLDLDLRTERDPYRLNYWLTGPLRNAIQSDYELHVRLRAPSSERHGNQRWLYVYVPRSSPSIGGQPRRLPVDIPPS